MPGGALAATASIGGALIGSSAAKKAAKTQANAANDAAQMQMQQFQQTRADMAPWRNVGGGALGMLAQLYNVPYGFNGQPDSGGGGGFNAATYGAANQDLQAEWQTMLGNGTAQAKFGGDPNAYYQWHHENFAAKEPWRPGVTPAQPQATSPANANDPANRFGSFFASPDYQFRLNESMNALTGNRATAGLLNSGGTVKATLERAGNLASGEFNNYVNRLSSLAGVGQTANYNTGLLGANAANNASNALMAGASATAGGIANQSGMWTNALGQVGNTASNYFANRPYSGGYNFGASGFGSNPFANVTADDFGATPSFNFGTSGISF